MKNVLEAECGQQEKSRSLEIRLRRQIKALQDELENQRKVSVFWKNKYLKGVKCKTSLCQKLKRITKKVETCESQIAAIRESKLGHGTKQKIASLFHDKEKGVGLKHRIVSKHYRLKESGGIPKKNTGRAGLMREVVDFYLRDGNSSTAPGVRETVTFRKEKKQKRYLCDSIDNLYTKYKAEVTNPVSRATFYRLRPFWVVAQNINSRDTCLCRQHTNFQLLLDKLYRLKLISTNKIQEFVELWCCDPNAKECVMRTCQTCKTRAITNDNASTQKTWYYCWVTEKIVRPGAKGKMYNVVITRKKQIECTVDNIIATFNDSIPKFFAHYYTTNYQFRALNIIKENLAENEIHLVIDFSQNYVCKYNREIHSAHFGASKKQVSLHTGGFYWKNSAGELKVKTFVSVSETLRHDAAAIWAHLQPIWKLIRETVGRVDTINIQSDGPSTQYKNKSNFFLFHHFSNQWGLKNTTWNFTSAGHGKSIADGAGANVKGLCDRAVAHGEDIVGAQDIVNLVNEKSAKITAVLITEKEMEAIDAILPKKLITIPRTAKVHQIIWTNQAKKSLFFRSLSCRECFRQPECIHHGLKGSDINYQCTSRKSNLPIQKTFIVGDWIVVFHDYWLPGKIVSIEDTKITADFLERNGNDFVRPKNRDRQDIHQEQIILKIEPPREVRKRRVRRIFYSFTSGQKEAIERAVEDYVA